MNYVSLAAYPENPADMYSRKYYTVAIMSTETMDTVGKIYRSNNASKMKGLAKSIAKNHNLELVNETY